MGALEAQTSGGPRARALASASMIRCLLAVLALAGVAHADGGDWERIADRDDVVVRLIYEQIHVPLVKDRDVTLRIRRTFSAETGVYEVASVAVPDEGP